MSVQTLQVGDELLLNEDIRLTVLAVEGDCVLLGVAALGCVRLPVPDAAYGNRGGGPLRRPTEGQRKCEPEPPGHSL
jgi:hypothetical protein